ncbi:hypothetical protein G6F24_013499 [Rhizopus arrhizus]|nr:hypothetical protein G6F24_013499 [Rhizopus arrhizus]
MAALIAAVGLFQLGKLPIDAVPDITNRQVQINTVAPALTPEQIERQVTYPLETALAGIPGLLWIQQGDGHNLQEAAGHAGVHLRDALTQLSGELAARRL